MTASIDRLPLSVKVTAFHSRAHELREALPRMAAAPDTVRLVAQLDDLVRTIDAWLDARQDARGGKVRRTRAQPGRVIVEERSGNRLTLKDAKLAVATRRSSAKRQPKKAGAAP